ncbi:MAG: hypothetical protein N2511_07565 [Thermodesulfovibrionales bacterium]|nr:hypothetical protein [Thermodesulfovibrionales bacterium]
MIKEVIKGVVCVITLTAIVITLMYYVLIKQSIIASIIILSVFLALFILVPLNLLRSIYRYLNH